MSFYEQISKLESSISDTAEEKKELDDLRSAQLSGLANSIMLIYDKVQIHRDGVAVVEISGGACGGCGAHVPPQVITEVRAKEGLHRCGVCGRYLFNNTKLDN